jgi:transposase
MPLTKLVYCVTIAFKMTERADHLHHDNAPAHSTGLVQAFLAKRHITQVCWPPNSPDLAPYDFWLFPKLKSPLKGRRFVNATVTQYTSSVNGVSLPTD